MHATLRVTLLAAALLLAIPVVLPRETDAALGQVSVSPTGLNDPLTLAQPRASFTAIPNPASPGMQIRFNSSSSDPDGYLVSEAWDFGDGQLGAGTVVTHAYGTIGTYVAALVVTDNQTLTTRTTQTITIQNPPLPPTAAFFFYGDTHPNGSVTFDASFSMDPDGTITSYAWDFGDAAYGSGMIASHSFASGRYAVTLTVFDNDSLSGNVSHDMLVNAPPQADIVHWPSVIYKGTAVAFDASGSYDVDGTIVSYVWWFGDGAIATGRLVAHVYERKGTYPVTLTITDDVGLTDQTWVQLILPNRPAKIVSTDPDPGLVSVSSGSSRTFTVTASDPDGDTIKYWWEADGRPLEFSPSFDFRDTALGNHTVKVSISDSDGGPATDSREWIVTVTPAGGPSGIAWSPVIVLLPVILLVLVLAWWRTRQRQAAP